IFERFSTPIESGSAKTSFSVPYHQFVRLAAICLPPDPPMTTTRDGKADWPARSASTPCPPSRSLTKMDVYRIYHRSRSHLQLDPKPPPRINTPTLTLMKSLSAVFALTLMAWTTASAEVKLPAIISDHMVL